MADRDSVRKYERNTVARDAAERSVGEPVLACGQFRERPDMTWGTAALLLSSWLQLLWHRFRKVWPAAAFVAVTANSIVVLAFEAQAGEARVQYVWPRADVRGRLSNPRCGRGQINLKVRRSRYSYFCLEAVPGDHEEAARVIELLKG